MQCELEKKNGQNYIILVAKNAGISLPIFPAQVSAIVQISVCLIAGLLKTTEISKKCSRSKFPALIDEFYR